MDKNDSSGKGNYQDVPLVESDNKVRESGPREAFSEGSNQRMRDNSPGGAQYKGGRGSAGYRGRNDKLNRKRKNYVDSDDEDRIDEKQKLNDKINKNVPKEKKIANSIKSIEERVNKRKNKSSKNIFMAYIEQEDGTIDYYKWIALLIVITICVVVFLVLSQMDIEECTCES